MEGQRMTIVFTLLPILLTLAGEGEMHFENRQDMDFSIGTVGVYGSAPPRKLQIDSSGLACAVNLSHDLQRDMTLRRFTGIGSKCINATDEMHRQFELLAMLVVGEKPKAPGRGDHYLQYSLGKGSAHESGVLSIGQDEETETINQAAQIFHSLHHQISIEGHVGAGIRPEIRLHDGRSVELIVHNIGNMDVSMSSPREWKDSEDPMVPRVAVSIWGEGRSTVAALNADNLFSSANPENPVEIPAGESVSLKFRLSTENLEDIRLLQDAQIGGRLRLHVQFEDGPRGMATGNVEAAQVKLPK